MAMAATGKAPAFQGTVLRIKRKRDAGPALAGAAGQEPPRKSIPNMFFMKKHE